MSECFLHPYIIDSICHSALYSICPSCGNRFLVEPSGAKHPAARRAERLDYWGTVVWNVVREQEFTCMNCGILYDKGNA